MLVVLAGLLALPVWAFYDWLGHLGRQPAGFERVDAIVSLAGGSGRMDAGLDLLQQEQARLLLLSGTHRDATLEEIFPSRDLSEVPEGSVILLESRSRSTWENALEARGVLSTRGEIDSLALITSNYHLRRAEFVFQRVFPGEVEIHAYPVHDEDVQPGRWWRTRRGRRLVLTEFSKWCWYWTRYGG